MSCARYVAIAVTYWGVHNDRPELDLVENAFVSVGWSAVGDLTAVGQDKEAMKARLRAVYPGAKKGAIPVWAGVLLRFGFEMQIGDLVIYPHKPDSTLNFGRLDGPYRYEPGAALHPHRRAVTWLHTGVPRERFSQRARWELGSSVTLFSVKNHAHEFADFLEAA
jgi:restriction system protein